MNLIERALADPREFGDRLPDTPIARREDDKHTSYLALTVNR